MSSILGLPDNNKSLTSAKNLFLFAALCLLKIVLIGGNNLSTLISISLDVFLAAAASPALKPICSLSIWKNSGVLSPLALILPATLSIHLSILLLLISNFLFLCATFLIPAPTPPRIPVNNAPSVPNLTLFNSSLPGSFSSSCKLNASEPAASTSPTNTPSAIPPVTAPAKSLAAPPPPLIFFIALANLGLLAFNNVPVLPALIAFSASLLPSLKPYPPGIPMLTSSSVIFPAAVASALSSNVVRSSKNCSTSAALLVPAPRSISVAPNENAPLGIAIKPDAMPDRTDSIVPTRLKSSAIYPS